MTNFKFDVNKAQVHAAKAATRTGTSGHGAINRPNTFGVTKNGLRILDATVRQQLEGSLVFIKKYGTTKQIPAIYIAPEQAVADKIARVKVTKGSAFEQSITRINTKTGKESVIEYQPRSIGSYSVNKLNNGKVKINEDVVNALNFYFDNVVPTSERKVGLLNFVAKTKKVKFPNMEVVKEIPYKITPTLWLKEGEEPKTYEGIRKVYGMTEYDVLVLVPTNIVDKAASKATESDEVIEDFDEEDEDEVIDDEELDALDSDDEDVDEFNDDEEL